MVKLTKLGSLFKKNADPQDTGLADASLFKNVTRQEPQLNADLTAVPAAAPAENPVTAPEAAPAAAPEPASYQEEPPRDEDHSLISPGEPITRRPYVPPRAPEPEIPAAAETAPLPDNASAQNGFSANTHISGAEKATAETAAAAYRESPATAPAAPDYDRLPPEPAPEAAPEIGSVYGMNNDQPAFAPEAASAASEPAPDAGAAPAPNAASAPEPAQPQAKPDLNAFNQTYDPRYDEFGGTGVHVVLFIRQLFASFFTHTNLDLLLPRLSLKMGPCYPSSMPIPYLFTGLLTALLAVWLQSTGSVYLCGGYTLALFLLIVGLNGIRGVGNMLAVFSQRRPDPYMKSATTAVYLLLFASLTDTVFTVFPATVYTALALGTVFMLAALAATSLNFGFRQDPVDYYGSMSTTGLILSTLFTALICYAVLSPWLATSLMGLALLLRLIIGHLMNLNRVRTSRLCVDGALHLILLFLLADLIVMGQSLPLLNPFIFG